MPRKLTATIIKSLQPGKKRYLVTDSRAPGLALKISPSGGKYFYYRYRPSGGRKIVEEPIGNALSLSLTDARKAASIKAGKVAKGIDLKEQRRSLLEEDAGSEHSSELELFKVLTS
jgi:hypothetical protein